MRDTEQRILGVDLGQSQDYSACAFLRGTGEPPRYECPLLRRWPLHTPYKAIALDLARLCLLREVQGAQVIVDATGVGRPVVEMVAADLKRLGVTTAPPVAVTITSGSAVSEVGKHEYRVAKKQLVSTLSVLIHSDRLRVSEAMPETPVLLRELSTFSCKIDASTANESYESWRERDHDDLVLAVAMAAWWPTRPTRPRFQVQVDWGEIGINWM